MTMKTPLLALVLALVATPAVASPESDLANAAANGDLGSVRALVANGANLNLRDPEGYTPLIWAAQHGQAQVAAYLIEHGANVNPLDNGGYTPLMWATQEGYYDTVSVLLSHGANPHARGMAGRTAMDLVAYARDGRVRDLLAKYDMGAMKPTAARPVAVHALASSASFRPVNPALLNGLSTTAQAPQPQPMAMAAKPPASDEEDEDATPQEPDPIKKVVALKQMAESAGHASQDIQAYAKASAGSLSLNTLADPDIALGQALTTMYGNLAKTQSLVQAREDWKKANAAWNNRPDSRFAKYVAESDQILKGVSL